MKNNWLKLGTKVRLWPADTYAKYAFVKEVTYYTVTFEITRVEAGEPFYKPGYRVTLPWSHINVIEDK